MSTIYSMTDTWNDAAVTFYAIKMNVTDTNSAAASKLVDLQVASVSKFNVSKGGAPSWTGAWTGALGIITTSQPNTSTQTWNAGGVTFKTHVTNVTDTASAAGSLFFDYQIAGVTKCALTKLGDLTSNLRVTQVVAPTIASAGTIAPTKAITFISGVAAIATITAPSPISATGGEITLIPTGIFTWTTGGNIALAGTAVVGKALILFYDATTTKWYPSYT